METLFVNRDGVRLHAVVAGPAGGPLVVLLHGFPEFWYGWRRQIPALAEAGFRVVAPDGRGYNNSDKPREIHAYHISELGRDVLAIADALGRSRFRLAGHDWGGAVAWHVSQHYPERVERLAVLNIPHPAVAMTHLRSDPRQMGRSWYMLFFQLPGLPEELLSAGDFAVLRRSLTETSRPGTFTENDIGRYRAAWSKPGALRSMIAWYRALRYHRQVDTRPVSVPTRILWGQRDRFLRSQMAAESKDLCRQGELFLFPDATHWLPHEEPEQVNRLLLEFFT